MNRLCDLSKILSSSPRVSQPSGPSAFGGAPEMPGDARGRGLV